MKKYGGTAQFVRYDYPLAKRFRFNDCSFEQFISK